jgi:hypothetical protein
MSRDGSNHSTKIIKNIIKELRTESRKPAVISTSTAHHEATAGISWLAKLFIGPTTTEIAVNV